MEAIGAVDELNSAIGMLAAKSKSMCERIRALLPRVQNDLFDLGAELSYPGHKCLTQESLEYLEAVVADLNSHLPPLREFILPGGSEAGALCHLARTICRSAERRVVALQEAVPSEKDLKIPYLNRLSDLLFVLARAINQADGVAETCWVPATKGKQEQ